MSSDVTTVPSAGYQYYGVAKYWNDFESVRRRLNERATGDPDQSWILHLQSKRGSFRKALVLNCGNGWVDRELQAAGVVAEVVGIDIDETLVDSARASALAAGHTATYARVDINVDPLPDGPFDLVVNHAACHHIAAIDRVLRELARRIEPGGTFVHWDYVGPHRNQWTARAFERAWEANQALPAELRQRLGYPHLETMLYTDPTEAVHSELIVPMLARYFEIDELRPLGGGVAYLLLTHNGALHAAPEASAEDAVAMAMDADQRFLDEAPDETLFAYILATPRAEQPVPKLLARWTAEEDARESAAAADGGRYYPPTLLAELYHGTGVRPGNPSRARRLRTAVARRLPRVAAVYRDGRATVGRLLDRGRAVEPGGSVGGTEN